MRTISSSLIILSLLAGAAHSCGIASAADRQASVPSPVVIERFSAPHPRVGQRETVYVQALDRNKPVIGAQVTTRVLLGKRTLLTMTGSRTNHTGRAQASFTIPSVAKGKSLRVVVTVLYKGYRFPGSDDLHVRG
jgi:hypothetical protein